MPVSITATSGTFSDSDFAKLGYGDSTIVYTDAYSVSTVYKLKIETASILEFEAIDAASRNNLKLIDVNKSTKVYSMTSIAMITSSTISSGSATSGKVLTANGSGGTSWETVGGGGLQKFSHSFSSWNSADFILLRKILSTASCLIRATHSGSFGKIICLGMFPTTYSSSMTQARISGTGFDNSGNVYHAEYTLKFNTQQLQLKQYTIDTTGTITYSDSVVYDALTVEYLNDSEIS